MQTKQSIKLKKSNHQPTDSKKNKSLITGTIIAAFVIGCPFLFYLYQGFPEGPVWESPFGIYTSYSWKDVNTLAWIVLGKLIPFLLLLIWFFTCKHWWYHAILVPLCMYAFQIYSTISEDIRSADTVEIYVLAPVIFIMAIFSYTIRTKVFDKIHGIDLSELSRVNWRGDIQNNKEHNKKSSNNEHYDQDDEPMYMSE